MLFRSQILMLAAMAAIASSGTSLFAADPELVAVGNPGNKADSTGFGEVGYEYRIGKVEVSNDQYAEFLNAVAVKDDKYKLYNAHMSGDKNGEDGYCGIDRTGDAGNYKYTVKAGRGKKPVNYVSWIDAVRYVNWLSNGKGAADTETGPYVIKDGKATPPDHAKLAAGAETKWVLPTENEWYKAAYYDANKAGGAGYWKYATKSDTAPSASNVGGTTANQANFNTDEPSEGGALSGSASAYGTFDQNGNMWEWNENNKNSRAGLRGGSFFLNDNTDHLSSGVRYDVPAGVEYSNYGFRVAAVGAAKK